MRVLVCGGRDFNDTEKLHRELDRLHAEHKFTFVIEGGARGADRHAKVWAVSRGLPGREYRAEWDKYGLAAGPLRNQRMLQFGKPDLVVAFPGHGGTADMVERAVLAGVRVIEIE